MQEGLYIAAQSGILKHRQVVDNTCVSVGQRKSSSRLPALDVARGLTITAVVMLHGLSSGPVAAVPGRLWYVVYLLGAIRMPLLLLVSGFLSASILTDRTRAVSRVTMLVWLYVLWSCVSYPFEYYITGHAPPGLLRSLVLPETYMWFLVALALMTTSLALLPGWGAALLGLSLVAWSVIASPSTLGWHDLAVFGPFFYLGALLPGLVGRLLKAKPLAMLLLIVGFVAVRSLASGDTQRLLSGLLGCAVMLPLAGLVARMPVVGFVLNWLGRRTLPIYLVHMPVLIVARQVMPAGAASLALAMLAAVVLPLILYAVRGRFGLRGAFEAPDNLVDVVRRGWST